EAPIYRADFAVRAVPITSGGHHLVRFEYRPASARAGAILSALAAAVAISLAALRRRPSRALPPHR
ncbi:MAG TPA: hypothetical protein VIG99_32160, partial [Myxococcaceae bacterium]